MQPAAPSDPAADPLAAHAYARARPTGASPTAPDAPLRADVLVIGAGPAGAACAQLLARQGLDTLLVDQHDFPRDKVCGDGLIPDAHRAFARLGVLEEVSSLAQPASFLACIAPRGGRIDVPGTLSVLPRRVLDDILVRGARRAGARWLAPWRFETLEPHADGMTAWGRTPAHERQRIDAKWVVLATGAAAGPLQVAGVCRRHTPSGIALRGYVHHPAMASRLTAMEIIWHPKLARGYGWIFPVPDGRFNVGVGLAQSHQQDAQGRGSMQQVNLRALLQTFCEVYEPARALVDGGTWDGPVKGAPLRCSLEGADWARPGLLVAGEAAGSTYAFSGEGIGKAMETGMLAAEALIAVAASRGPAVDQEAATRYTAALQGLKPRFDLYERANKVNAHPWLADLLVWRAKREPRILRRMAGVLEETSNPGNLVSMRGIARLLLPLR